MLMIGIASAVLAATGAVLSQDHLGARAVIKSPPESATLSLARTVTVGEAGCNATAFAQLPDQTALFIGRQQITAEGRLAGITGPNDCSGGNIENEATGKPYNRWALVLNALDWNTRQFHLVKPLIDTSLDRRTGRPQAVITGGPMRGLIIRSAYDPSVVKYNGEIFVSFECTVDNGASYGVQETSSCVAVYDPATRSIDLSRTIVAISGERKGNTYHVASVPRLLNFGGKLYLYWAASIVRDGKIVRSDARGAELELNLGIPRIRGAGNRVVKPIDSASTLVWGTESSPSDNLIANIKSFLPLSNSFLVLAVLGGGDCQSPAGTTPGCFRLAVRRSTSPLGPRGFNSAPPHVTNLPTNSHEYATPVVDPSGNWWLLGHFRRPAADGFANRAPAPGHQFWSSTQRPSVLALIPADF